MTLQEWLGEDNKLGQDIVSKKYFAKGENFDDWIGRISNGDEELKQLILDKKFLFGGRTLANYNTNNGGSTSNCYSIGYVEDDTKYILDLVSQLGMTYKSQGGQGLSLSKIRPKGSAIGENGYTTDGIVPFMKLFDVATESISQGGTRKGALMMSLDVWHKEAENFINIKTDTNSINKANLSLEIDNSFMREVVDGSTKNYREFHHKSGVEKYEVNPTQLFDLLCEKAWDYAEPGIIYTNKFRNDNLMQLDNEYNIVTSNPSLRKGTMVATEFGIVPIESLEGKEFLVPTMNKEYAVAKCFLSGNNKQLYRITLSDNSKYYCTPEHRWAVLSDDGSYQKKYTTELKSGDLFPRTQLDVLSNGEKGSYEDGLFFGFWYGDGSVTLRKDGRYQYGFTFGAEKQTHLMPFMVDHISNITQNKYNPTERSRGGKIWHEFSSSDVKLKEYFNEFGVYNKVDLPTCIYTELSENFRRGFIDGIFSSDGSVDLKYSRMGLTSKSEQFINNIYSLLQWYGIYGDIGNRRSTIKFKSGHEYKDYICYYLNLSKFSCHTFKNKFSLTNKTKQLSLENIEELKKNKVCYNNISVKSVEITDIYEDVWDISVYDDTHTFSLNTCITGNCGEQPLPKHGACNLGSINLSEFIINPYTYQAYFDEIGFRNAVHIAIKALDEVIDYGADLHALEEQKEMAKLYRNIGLGLMGIGSAFFKMRMKYGSQESTGFISKVMKIMFFESVIASSDIAVVKGSFPKYTENVFDSDIIIRHFNETERKNLKSKGLRNCSLISFAPSGSIGTLLGVSTGIEPAFSLSYKRKTESLHKDDVVYYDVFLPEIVEYKKLFPDEVTLPDFFIASSDIHYRDRVYLQSIVQFSTDTAISSTVNLPNSATVEDVKDLYIYAWEMGLKGITIYRSGCKREGILTETGNDNSSSIGDITSADKYNYITPVSRKQIGTTSGNTYCKKTACGTMYVTINRDSDGNVVESFVSTSKGGVCQSNIGAINRMISVGLRSGVKVEEIADQLLGITCQACVRVNAKGEKLDGVSCPDILGKTLLEFYNDSKIGILSPVEPPTSPVESHLTEQGKDTANPLQPLNGAHKCPECGEPLRHEGGCVTCMNCSYSKCE